MIPVSAAVKARAGALAYSLARPMLPTIPRRSIASSSTSFAEGNEANNDIPFYGLARSQAQPASSSSLELLLQNAATAFMDPTRADAVAAVGELTGSMALQRLLQAMQSNETGRLLLQERPIVSKEKIPYESLLQSSRSIHSTLIDEVSFGQAYGAFLSTHDFDPDERDDVKYIDDPDLAYVMLRYRQNHDFFHTITGLPPTVLGELALKWLELFQTGLPLAALSSTFGSLRLDSNQQHILWTTYLPWAKRTAQQMEYGALMMVYYEKEWETPLVDLRRRLGVDPAPVIAQSSR